MQKRIILLVVVSILIVVVSLGLITYLSVNESIRRTMENHLSLATTVGENIESILESNITRLHDLTVSGMVDFEDDDWEAEKRALKTAYEYSIFTDGVFLLDTYGNVIATYPHKEEGYVNMLSIPFVSRAISEGKSVVSDVYTVSPTMKKVIFVLVPLKNKNGVTIGAAGGEINPANYMFSRIIKSSQIAKHSRVELIDSHGIIISSNDSKRVLTYSDHNKYLGNLIASRQKTVGKCHTCHMEGDTAALKENDILAFAPLTVAPWGVSVRDPQEIMFEPATRLKKAFLSIGLVFILTALLLAVGLSKSIVAPIRVLIDATDRIAKGYLNEPVKVTRDDEIGVLATGFETMRLKLFDSLDRVRRYNVELEKRVLERTAKIAEHKQQLAKLLNEVITAQEAERMRIARELHDETCQSLAACGMSLEIASMALAQNQLSQEMLLEQKRKIAEVLDGINLIIQDLRPLVLDDLGLESAIRWLLEKHLAVKGIKYFFSYCNELNNEEVVVIDKKTELAIFRVIQEAIVNIYKYANSKKVIVIFECGQANIEINIIDDGVGFNAEKILSYASGDDSGFGLLGMKERVSSLEGSLDINSKVGEGTHINISIPIRALTRMKNV